MVNFGQMWQMQLQSRNHIKIAEAQKLNVATEIVVVEILKINLGCLLELKSILRKLQGLFYPFLVSIFKKLIIFIA